MAPSRDMQVATHRLALSALGCAAALALWFLGESWGNPVLPPSAYLALFTFVCVQAGVALALAGPIDIRRALVGTLLLALPVTALVSLAGQRYLVATDLLDDPVMLAVVSVLVLVSTPFLSVRLQRGTNWLRYAALFDAAWTITVRYGAAWVFVAVVWLVAILSDALLELVGITVIDKVLNTDWARFALTGGVLGLGLAVTYELRATVSPYLFLRLLRLLVPVVLVVVGVFVVAVPFRGLSRLFGDFSTAGTLMGAAIMAVTLVSSALDRNDEAAVSTPGIRLATRALAVLVPLLAGLAVWAVVLRVRQYGWTPDRVLAGCVALFLLLYGVGYCVSVLSGRGWAGRIRQVNVAMALAVIAVSALWMTPLLDAYRISAASQVTRFQDGRLALDDLALWSLAHDWGRAGLAGLDRLEAMATHPDHAELSARIATVRIEANPFRFDQEIARRRAPARAAELAALLVARPEGTELPAQVLARMPTYQLDQWLAGCRHALPDGRPGCVLVRGTFAPSEGDSTQGMVLYLTGDGQARASFLLLRPDADPQVREVYDPVADAWPVLDESVVAQVLDGAFDIAPSGGKALFVGGLALVPGY